MRPGRVGELGQRRSSPERERLPQHRVRGRRVCDPRSAEELLEAEQVERPDVGTELVCGGDGPDDVAAERPAQLRDVGLENLRGRGRRPAVPELLDQAIARDRLVRPEEQDREKGPRL